MGGKRPDQHRIAPEEAGATDYKNYPLEPGDLRAQPGPENIPETPFEAEREAQQVPQRETAAEDDSGA